MVAVPCAGGGCGAASERGRAVTGLAASSSLLSRGGRGMFDLQQLNGNVSVERKEISGGCGTPVKEAGAGLGRVLDDNSFGDGSANNGDIGADVG